MMMMMGCMTCVTLGVVAALLLLKLYNHVTKGVCRSKRRMDGKTVIVTGANTGIGKETARNLAARGARVILACRDMARANQARDEITATTGNSNVETKLLDLASLTSVREFAADVLRTEKRLDVLVNNAGVAGMGRNYSQDKLLVPMQINHMGPFLLTNLLLGLLKASAPSRIVVVSSDLHRWGKIDLDNFNSEKNFNTYHVYNDSKLANVMMTIELADKLQDTGVTANSLHPGLVDTHIFRRMPNFTRICFQFILATFFKTPVEGAQTSIYLAVSEEVEGVTGKYFNDCQEGSVNPLVRDVDLRCRLWQKTQDWVHLTPKECLY